MSDRPPIDPEQWDRIADCFEQAIALPSAERAAFVATTLGDDAVARREVEVVLAEHERGRPLSIEDWLVIDALPDDTALTAGSRIGHYRIERLVGQGGMGEVYAGERVEGDYEQSVAIKVLRSGYASSELLRRFKAERRILARLTHPNIVGILDGGSTDDGRPFLVMPFVDGVPITTHCDAKTLDLDARLRLFVRVMLAVQYAHGQLVVHRDIKPSNILVTKEGDVQLLDFGIAKLMSGGDRTTGAETRSELRLLTPEHAAPEQLRGEEVSTATDVYSLGVLLYELLTGTKPHRANGRSLADLERAIAETEPVAPSQVATGTPWARRVRGDLDRIVLMALRKEPARRYTSVGQFADDIERFLKGLPVSAERDSLGYRARKFVRRNRGAVLATSAAALLLVFFSIGTAWQARQLARERDRARREQLATETVVQLLTSMFALANPIAVPGGDTLRVPQLLSAGEALIDSLPDAGIVQARMWSVLGTMHLARGQMERGHVLLTRAYDRMMASADADSLEVARTAFELARAIEGHEGLTKALPWYRSALDRLRLAGAPRADLVIAERELATRTGDVVERERILERLLAESRIAYDGDSLVLASNLNALATQRLNTGAVPDAVALFEESLRVLDALRPANHPDRLTVAGNLAIALRDQGAYPAAERIAREILVLTQAQVTPHPLAIAGAEERLAAITGYRGFLEDAESGLRRALTLERGALADAHHMIINTTFNLGVVALARGRPRDAMALLDSSITLARRAGAGDADTLPTADYRASILLFEGRTREAATILQIVEPRIRLAVPGPQSWVAFHDEQMGTLALAESRPGDALRYFERAAVIWRARVLAGTPEAAGADCGRGIALRRLGRLGEATPLLRDACSLYRQFGVHSRLLLRWAGESA